MRKIIFTAIVILLIAGISIAIYAQSNGIETEHDTLILFPDFPIIPDSI